MDGLFLVSGSSPHSLACFLFQGAALPRSERSGLRLLCTAPPGLPKLKDSCSRVHGWQVGAEGFELNLTPELQFPTSALRGRGGCWSHCSAFLGVPSFLALKFPHPFHETKAQQEHRHNLLRRQLGAVVWRSLKRFEHFQGVCGGISPNTCSQLVPFPGCVIRGKHLYPPVSSYAYL